MAKYVAEVGKTDSQFVTKIPSPKMSPSPKYINSHHTPF